jgi:hypothetical protein
MLNLIVAEQDEVQYVPRFAVHLLKLLEVMSTNHSE